MSNVATPISCPVGSIMMWGSLTPPSGWLICEGQVLLQSDYQKLYNVIGHSFGNPTNNPAYNPGTEFYIPDLRGRFVRGVDDASSNRDPDRNQRKDMQADNIYYEGVGSVQSDEFKRHSHDYNHIKGKGGIANGNHWASKSDTTSETGGNETRPINVYLYYIIKYDDSI